MPLPGEADGPGFFIERPGGGTRWAYTDYQTPFPLTEGGNWTDSEHLYRTPVMFGDATLKEREGARSHASRRARQAGPRTHVLPAILDRAEREIAGPPRRSGDHGRYGLLRRGERADSLPAVEFRFLEPGDYRLKLDGESLDVRVAEQLAKGVAVDIAPNSMRRMKLEVVRMAETAPVVRHYDTGETWLSEIEEAASQRGIGLAIRFLKRIALSAVTRSRSMTKCI